ncbi:MAG: LamG domain-containing protein [Candidatus Poribacteria bacterium]|jgi:hypothetical protein|nr:LamG domain-containing protein [Candidatus Poribacteria bacterium]MDP6746870.1 LamG domain-containing protein [Candidatus Poribacteria bacterium]MDP6998203.1 LamG domain-containing protein [Candidatus Poribacteria bacterium]
MRSNFLILLAVACLTLLTSAADAEFDKKGLVGAWLFDEGKGKEVKDSSDNKLHASFDMGKPKWVKGKFGGGLEFDGKSQVTVPDNKLMHLEDFTLSAWMNSPKISGKWQILASKENRGVGGNRNYGIFGNINSGVIHYSFTSGGWKSFDAKTVVTDGKWHYITTTYKNPDFKLYVDGKVDAEVKPGAVPDTPKNKFFIGGCDIGGYWMTGTLDDIVVFNRALSEKEINQLMKDGLKTSLAVGAKEKLVTVWGKLKQTN